MDTHCHLGDGAYDSDRGEVVLRARDAGLGHIVVIGESIDAADRALELAEADPFLSATAGIHPHAAGTWTTGTAEWLSRRLAHPRVVAAGEMGLDYHYDHAPRDEQRRTFDLQLEAAAAAGKPAIVHAREADDDVAAALRNHPSTRVILHSFSSGLPLLDTALGLGHYVSFSGMVTFRSWTLDEAIRAVPVDRILIETDGPYLAPVPHRGQRNEPAFVGAVAARIAAVREEPAASLVAATGGNAARVFGIRLDSREHRL